MSVLTFLCLHIFRHQKQQKGLRGGGWLKKRSQTGMQSQPLTCSDLYKLSLHISLTILYSCWRVGLACCVFDEDIFDLPTSLSLNRHLSQTRGISLSADDDDDSRVISKVLMKLTSGGVERECAFNKQIWHRSVTA